MVFESAVTFFEKYQQKGHNVSASENLIFHPIKMETNMYKFFLRSYSSEVLILLAWKESEAL